MTADEMLKFIERALTDAWHSPPMTDEERGRMLAQSMDAAARRVGASVAFIGVESGMLHVEYTPAPIVRKIKLAGNVE